jgi:hypothetical protein
MTPTTTPGAKPGQPPPIESLAPEQKPNLARGSRGKPVGHLQDLLNAALGDGTLTVDEDYGGMTEDAVMLFQHRRSMPINGKVAVEEWRALATTPRGALICATATNWMMQNLCFVDQYPTPQDKLPAIAAGYIGAEETGDNKMGTDARMKEIFEADDLTIGGNTDGYAWCCSYVSLCVQKLLAQNPWHFSGIVAPREPAVSNFLNSWAPSQGCLIFKPTSKVIKPEAGDIVVFTFSHIGIVETPGTGAVETIEGNTNEEGSREGKFVMRKTRNLTSVRKFIRLPIKRLLN